MEKPLNSNNSAPGELSQALMDSARRYTQSNPLSLQRHRQARESMPGGHTRETLFHKPFPLTIVTGRDGTLTDLDGHNYCNLLGDYTAGVYGHSPAEIQAAIGEAARNGLSLGAINTKEQELAESIKSRIPSMELVRFTHSGSEACMFSVLLARHATQRPAILAFRGAYHGGFMIYSDPEPALNVPFDVVKATYNDIEGTRRLLRDNQAKLAAVIVEPMMGSGGCIPARQEFLQMLRVETANLGIVLIFDEVMTSRLGPHGVQGLYGIRPDLTTLGKYWGGGFGFGAFGGARHWMQHFDTGSGGALSQAGTYNNNMITMAAGLAGVRSLFTPQACIELNRRGDALRQGVNAAARRAGVALQATGLGSVMNLHWHTREILSSADVEPSTSELRRLFHLEMLQRGFYLAPRGLIALSLATTELDTGGFLDALSRYLADYKAVLPVQS